MLFRSQVPAASGSPRRFSPGSAPTSHCEGRYCVSTQESKAVQASTTHRGLRTHRRLRDRGPCWPRRIGRLAVLASVRLRRMLCRPPRRAGARRWLIAPKDPDARITRRYLDGSLILVTTFETAQGAVELIDFMPPRDGISRSRPPGPRRARRVELRTEIILRFDYGAVVPWVERLEEAAVCARSPGRTVSCCARRCPRPGLHDRRRVRCRLRRSRAVRPRAMDHLISRRGGRSMPNARSAIPKRSGVPGPTAAALLPAPGPRR